jgi:type 1 fimbriae regulatory protein FimB/type 1 fimbriae regulatory protein FimE
LALVRARAFFNRLNATDPPIAHELVAAACAGLFRPKNGTVPPLAIFHSWIEIRKVIATKARQTMTKPTLRVVPPTTKIRKVTPRRPKNGEIRTREYLTEREVEQLIEGCKGNRRSHRDQTMILLAFRHGLRASELCDLQWTQVDFDHATLAVTRVKHGTPSTHPLTGRELRALRKLHREAEGKSPFLFLSERGSPMTVSNFQKLINRACEAAGLKIKAHPHMLRHACGFHQANAGRDTRSLQAYLGHKNIQHTVRYTELAPTRFKGWWKD